MGLVGFFYLNALVVRDISIVGLRLSFGNYGLWFVDLCFCYVHANRVRELCLWLCGLCGVCYLYGYWF